MKLNIFGDICLQDIDWSSCRISLMWF